MDDRGKVKVLQRLHLLMMAEGRRKEKASGKIVIFSNNNRTQESDYEHREREGTYPWNG